MRIECPACATAYEVPETQVAPGQLVRCARCGSDWTPVPPLPMPAFVELEPAPQPEPEPEGEIETAPPEPEPTPPPVPKPASKWPLRIAWVLSLVIVGAALAALYVERARIMQAWPPSTRAYAALGLLPRH